MRLHVQALLAALLTAAVILLAAMAGANALLGVFAQFSNAAVGARFDIYLQFTRFIVPGSAITAFFVRERMQGQRLTMLRSVAIGCFTGFMALALTLLGCWASVSRVLP
jgi:hypothetical protein